VAEEEEGIAAETAEATVGEAAEAEAAAEGGMTAATVVEEAEVATGAEEAEAVTGIGDADSPRGCQVKLDLALIECSVHLELMTNIHGLEL